LAPSSHGEQDPPQSTSATGGTLERSTGADARGTDIIFGAKVAIVATGAVGRDQIALTIRRIAPSALLGAADWKVRAGTGWRPRRRVDAGRDGTRVAVVETVSVRHTAVRENVADADAEEAGVIDRARIAVVTGLTFRAVRYLAGPIITTNTAGTVIVVLAGRTVRTKSADG
jgi:hypothetical protein